MIELIEIILHYPNKIKRKLTYWLRNVLQISCTKNKYLYKYLSIIIYEIYNYRKIEINNFLELIF